MTDHEWGKKKKNQTHPCGSQRQHGEAGAVLEGVKQPWARILHFIYGILSLLISYLNCSTNEQDVLEGMPWGQHLTVLE